MSTMYPWAPTTPVVTEDGIKKVKLVDMDEDEARDTQIMSLIKRPASPTKKEIEKMEKYIREGVIYMLSKLEFLLEKARENKGKSGLEVRCEDDPDAYWKYWMSRIVSKDKTEYYVYQSTQTVVDIRNPRNVCPVYVFGMKPDDTGQNPKGFLRAHLNRWQLDLKTIMRMFRRDVPEASTIMYRWQSYICLADCIKSLEFASFVINKVFAKAASDYDEERA